MRSLNTSIDMDALTWRHAILILALKHYHNGFIFSKRKGCDSNQPARTEKGSQNIVRNVSPLGLSWLVNCLERGSLRISLAFLNLIMLSLMHGTAFNKETDNYHSLGSGSSIRAPKAFFMTTTLPSVLWLSRSTKKGRNFNHQTVIGSGRINSAQNVAGVWGVCWHGATLFHSKH